MEDEDEFFESLEDILSTSSSDSGEEGATLSRPVNRLQTSMGRARKGEILSHHWYSGYEIWKSSPGTIPERRQRLLIEMGLEYQREGVGESTGSFTQFSSAESIGSEPYSTSTSSVVPVESSTGRFASSVSVPERLISENLELHKSLNLNKGENVRGIDGEAVSWSIARSRSDGSFSELEQSVCKEDVPVRLVKSGTNSPLLSEGCVAFRERLLENSGAVLRTGTGAAVPANPASKPPLGGKRTTGTPSRPNSSDLTHRSFAFGLVARRVRSHLNNSNRNTVMNMDGASLIEAKSQNGNFNLDMGKTLGAGQHDFIFQGNQKEVELREGGESNAETNADRLCRIKNLDSGKEFIVDKLGKDGLWNKLRELDTGRELTWEEFETSLGLSPIVQEVMRRERSADDKEEKVFQAADRPGSHKKKKGLLKFIKGVVSGVRERGFQGAYGSSSDEREGSTERAGRGSSSTTDDSQETTPQQRFKRIKVHSHKKSTKEFAELHLMQEFEAHQGAIWTMKFSFDGFYLASAGQDCIVRVWEVIDQRGRGESPDVSEELNFEFGKIPAENGTADLQIQKETGRSSKGYGGKKSQIHTSQPSKFFLSEKPRCSFQGHAEEILDLSWSRSQLLLSSSMDKTVRLWHVSRKECLSIFAHHDYVTCIQFNPVDDGYFISGSLDDKVRIWSIKDHQVVDWVDLREMVTAACYTPDGQGAVVGSYKGTCRLYNSSGNKLQLEALIDVQSSKRKKSRGKKITGFEFIPGDHWKVLITSSDSRIRVYDGIEIIHKYKGFRNTNSQMSASFSPDKKYIVCASEDSRVYIWTHTDSPSNHTGRWKEKSGSYEYFYSRNVLVAISWPGLEPHLKLVDSQSSMDGSCSSGRITVNGNYSPARTSSDHPEPDGGLQSQSKLHCKNTSSLLPNIEKRAELLRIDDKFNDHLRSEASVDSASLLDTCVEDPCGESTLFRSIHQHVGNHSLFSDSRGSATWPEEKLPSDVQASLSIDTSEVAKSSVTVHADEDNIDRNTIANTSAWGLVIVTASLGGEIRTFQNYSLPVQL